MEDEKKLELLQQTLRYEFDDSALLTKALTHKSYLNESKGKVKESNERLEFLGDAVLDLVVGTALIMKFPEEDEGGLSKMKAKIVNEGALAAVSRRLNLGQFLLLGRGEEQNLGREKNSLLADMLEAIIAAIYLDSNLQEADKFIHAHFTELFEELTRIDSTDNKSRLQSICQSDQYGLPSYSLLREYGPDHQKVFEIKLRIDKIAFAIGIGKTKKEAEQIAARIAIEKLLLRKSQTLEEGEKSGLNSNINGLFPAC